MSLKHITSSADIDKAGYDIIAERSEYFIKNGIPTDLMAGKVVATLAFQPSTRTMGAGQSAMMRAGGGWMGVTGSEGLSMAKDESLADTIFSFSEYADVIMLRHPDDDSAEIAAQSSLVPVLNAGSGSREHGLAGAFMIPRFVHYLGKERLHGATLGLYGTPEINRVSKALVPILGYYGVSLFIDDLGHFPLPKEVEEKAKANGIKEITYGKLDDFIGDVDMLMVTRGFQKGIIPEDKFPKEKAEAIEKYYKPITKEHMKKLRKDAFIDMFLPLIFEIERDVDSDPRAIYSKYGMHTEILLATFTYVLDIDVPMNK